MTPAKRYHSGPKIPQYSYGLMNFKRDSTPD